MPSCTALCSVFSNWSLLCFSWLFRASDKWRAKDRSFSWPKKHLTVGGLSWGALRIPNTKEKMDPIVIAYKRVSVLHFFLASRPAGQAFLHRSLVGSLSWLVSAAGFPSILVYKPEDLLARQVVSARSLLSLASGRMSHPPTSLNVWLLVSVIQYIYEHPTLVILQVWVLRRFVLYFPTTYRTLHNFLVAAVVVDREMYLQPSIF